MGELLFPSLGLPVGLWPLWLNLLIYLLVDDLMQYLYHRAAHRTPFLWKLHRPHHQAEEMGFFVSYRNACLYYVTMPNIWWMGIFTFLGGGVAVAIGLVLKQIVIIGSHSTLKWDAPLYKRPLFRPVIAVLERIFITPAFHHAHHGKSRRDGISRPSGNFGNMFSIWDQLFGSAVFNQKYPTELGLKNDPKEPWPTTMFWPLVTSDDPRSELSAVHQKRPTTSAHPASVQLEKGQQYLWCQCGLSQNQPFCDGSHHGTPNKPCLFTAKKTGVARLCNCKLTQNSPFCNGSHTQLDQSISK